MNLTFRSGNELVKFKIDRADKRFELATSKTNYRFARQPFWKLFGTTPGDMAEAVKEMEMCEGLNDEDFMKVVVESMRRIGYRCL